MHEQNADLVGRDIGVALQGQAAETVGAVLGLHCGATIKVRHSVNQGDTAPGWTDEGVPGMGTGLEVEVLHGASW